MVAYLLYEIRRNKVIDKKINILRVLITEQHFPAAIVVFRQGENIPILKAQLI
jgi:hypothetical protein